MNEAATARGAVARGAGDGALAAWLSLCGFHHRGMDAILNLQGRARMCWAHGEGGGHCSRRDWKKERTVLG